MLVLLSVHVTSVLFSVWFNNFALNTGFFWSFMLLLKVFHSYALMIHLIVHVPSVVQRFNWVEPPQTHVKLPYSPSLRSIMPVHLHCRSALGTSGSILGMGVHLHHVLS